MKRFIARPLTLLCSKLIYLLHNRNTFPFDRLELQSVQFSFSQFGEDLAVLRLAQQFGLAPGIYVDAGAYHPIFGSNTLLLHKQGWCGVNIDLAPERIAVFKRYRPKDYNIVACLSDNGAKVEIAHYEIASTDRVINSNNSEKLSIVGERPIRFSTATTTTLSEVIGQSPFRLEDVDYLNVDCEGSDLAVLRGLDFDRCRPRILSVEAFSNSDREAIVKLLTSQGYQLEVVIPPAIIFVQR
jgi:FkbM family methyltransferase